MDIEINSNNGIDIDVLELGIKPKDFIRTNDYNKSFLNRENIYARRKLDEVRLDDIEVMSNYLFWYPLILSCSFIRKNKNEPFASEYIIPQLLMQWLRSQISNNKLFGIRYFSCASIEASELGFNYVFPASGENYIQNQPYCNVLANTFRLLKPQYINEFESIYDCESYIISTTDNKLYKKI